MITSGGSRGQGTRDVPQGAQILSISSNFWENFAKSYLGTPHGELAPPPVGNPGAATDNEAKYPQKLIMGIYFSK